jgi:acyl-CoA thioester hydrolase
MSPSPPFEEYAGYSIDVDEAWIDYNGHLTDSAYAVILSDANEAFLDSLGLSEPYRERTGRSLYTSECHIRYRAEVNREQVRARTRLVELHNKAIRVATTLTRADGVDAAQADHVYVHVDGATGRPCEFDDDTRMRLLSVLSPVEGP